MKVYKDILQATTPHGKIEYKCYIANTYTADIEQYVTRDHCSALCKQGCSNYEQKWSCPPYAPSYQEFTKDYNMILTCLLTADMEQFDYIKNDYLKIKAANTILKSRIDKALRSLIGKDIYYISSGSCRLCRSCNCKIQESCKHPDIMTYSFEALGINVADMVDDQFDIPLLWYKKNHLPRYTSVVAGLVCNDDFEADKLIKALRKFN